MPPCSITWCRTAFTPSATSGASACLQFAPGDPTDLPAAFLIEVTSHGVQYMPRAAKAAYALDSCSGVTRPTPSVIDGYWPSGWPVCASTMPKEVAIFEIAHRPVCSDNWMK